MTVQDTDITGCPISGPGLPVGGSLGQHLAKRSSIDFDVEWVDADAGQGGGTGDVTGPDVSATHHLSWFVDGTGKKIADSGINADMLIDRLDGLDETNADQDDDIQDLDDRLSLIDQPFVQSGPDHAMGLVPDPGAVPGGVADAPLRFLKETAEWVAITSQEVTHTPSAPYTYPHTIYEDYEWDRVNTLGALTPAQRADTIGTDCWQELQHLIDWMMARNQSTTDVAIKRLRLVRTHRISKTLQVIGLAPAGPRQGRLTLMGGGLVAPDTWADQSLNPNPMVEFAANSQGSGLDGVSLNCNGVSSGVLVNSAAGGNAKIQIENCVIFNFANPQALTQAQIYGGIMGDGETVLVNIGGSNSVARAPLRDYELQQTSPYGLRVGQKAIYPVGHAAFDVNTTTCRISGNHIRQWELGRPELRRFTDRTGIGIYLAAGDIYLKGLTNNVADCLKSLVVQGHSIQIDDYHSSPSGGATEYDASNGPTEDVYLIGTEQIIGHNSYGINYHERILWLRDKKATVALQRFPRSPSSTDGNDCSIMLDATEVDESLGTSGSKLVILGNHHDGDLDIFKYREVDGNFIGKADTDLIKNSHVIFSAETHSLAAGDDAGDTVAGFFSSDKLASFAAFVPGMAEDWVTGVHYNVGSYTRAPDADHEDRPTNFVCLVGHNAGVFADDLAAEKWRIIKLARYGWADNKAAIRYGGVSATPIWRGDENSHNFTNDSDGRATLRNGGIVFLHDNGTFQLNPQTLDQINAMTVAQGCITFLGAGSAGANNVPVYYDGAAWKRFSDDSAVV